MRSFANHGAPPTIEELTVALGVDAASVGSALGQLHDTHGLVLHPGTSEIWIAHPFSASPTGVFVRGESCTGRGWWAPCIWCAMGIVVLCTSSASKMTIHTRFGGEHEEVVIEVANGILSSNPLVHFPHPPRDAWTNVVHWCASVLPFRSLGDVEQWSEAHRYPVGAVVRCSQVLSLAREWYGNHLAEDWRKWTMCEAQSIFDRVGLHGPFWRLPISEGTF